MHYSTHLYSQADHYRRRAIEARQRAVQAPDLSFAKAAFEEVAYHWVALAEQVEWLERWRGRLAEDFSPSPLRPLVLSPARSGSSPCRATMSAEILAWGPSCVSPTPQLKRE